MKSADFLKKLLPLKVVECYLGFSGGIGLYCRPHAGRGCFAVQLSLAQMRRGGVFLKGGSYEIGRA